MGLGPQRNDSKTFGTTVYGLTHPKAFTSRKSTTNLPVESFTSPKSITNLQSADESFK